MTAREIFQKAIETLNKTKDTDIKIYSVLNREQKDDSKGVNVEIIFKDGYRRSFGFNEAWYDPNNFNLMTIDKKIGSRPSGITDDEAVIMKIMCWVYYWAKNNGHL